MENEEEKTLTQKLLEGFNEKDRKVLEKEIAKSRLKVKILTTLLFKEKYYEDYTPVEKRKYLCQSECYKNVDLKNPETMEKQLENLESCVKQCSMASEDVKSYLENTDFMSVFKLEYCAEGCFSNTKAGSTERYDCYFDCYARLDRRYRGYWMKHRNKLINRYYYNMYDENVDLS